MSDLMDRYPDAVKFTPGDNHDLCEFLLMLMETGRKTATCMALADVANGIESMPVVGRRDIATSFEGAPRLVIETTEVSLVPFNEVTEGFALAEGENETLDGWRSDHAAYFARNGGFEPDMMLVCERFQLIEVVGPETG
ncbi:MAG: ASCH domain-containing protein [Pseudomonadota bacterium]